MGSFARAKEDGIKFENGRFQIPCSICGDITTSTEYSRCRTYLCKECRSIILSEKRKRKRACDNSSEAERRFQKAVNKLKKQGIDDSWDGAIRMARQGIDSYGSVPEAMMAIGLLYRLYSIIPQQHVGSRKVDFALPHEHRIVEVDGSLYHKDGLSRMRRDYEIMSNLGPQWEIMHVPAEDIEENVIEAIEFYVEKQKRPHTGDIKL